MDERQSSGYMQTTKQRRNPPRNVQATPSHTDILAKYQQKKQRRAIGQNARSVGHQSCFRESLYILFAWLGFLCHITFAVVPSWSEDKYSINDFYRDHAIEISPAHWNAFCYIKFQWGMP